LVHIHAFTGNDCVAKWEPFCRIDLSATAESSFSVNDSIGLRGFADEGGNAFCLGFGDKSEDCLIVVNALNCTLNALGSPASGLTITGHDSALIDFCRFHSNSHSGVLLVEDALREDTFSCLEFFNNTVSSSSIILVRCSCTISRSNFVLSDSNTLVGGFNADTSYSVRFVDCIFDRSTFTGAGDVNFESSSCVVTSVDAAIALYHSECRIPTPVPPAPVAPSSSPAPAATCFQVIGANSRQAPSGDYECYIFMNCAFEQTSNSAIYLYDRDCRAFVYDCQFVHCSQTEVGGCLNFGGLTSISVRRLAGIDCAATWEPFCKLDLNADRKGSLELNESSGTRGIASGGNPFCAGFSSVSLGCFEVITGLNCSLCQLGEASSALTITAHGSLVMQFCRFHANSRRAALLVEGAIAQDDVFPCLEFRNNTVSDDPSIVVSCSCSFRGCVFASTPSSILVGPSAGNAQYRVSFVQSIFDRGDFSAQVRVTLTLVECIVQQDQLITLDVANCWRNRPSATIVASTALPSPTPTAQGGGGGGGGGGQSGSSAGVWAGVGTAIAVIVVAAAVVVVFFVLKRVRHSGERLAMEQVELHTAGGEPMDASSMMTGILTGINPDDIGLQGFTYYPDEAP
jgi:hypothetical protein